MLVAVPLDALVMVAPSAKVVVPAGANQTLLVASPELTMVTVAPPFLVTLAAKTVSWLVGAVLSTVKVAPLVGAAVTTLPAKSVPVLSATVAVPSPAPTV